MSRKVNPTILGLFIVLGLALGVGGVIVFGSWKLFSKTEKYILYFNNSVKGLSAGAPVRFRGVPIGSVVETLIRHNQATKDTDTPVIIEIDESLVRAKTDRGINLSDDASFKRLIQQGLRGMLQFESLLTGMLYVELDIIPQAPAPKFHQIIKEYQEIPTVPTRIEALIDQLADINFKQITDQLNSILVRLDNTLSEWKMAEINQGLTNLLVSLNHMARSPTLTNSLASLQQTLDEYRRLSETVRTKIDPLSNSADATLKVAQTTLVEMRESLQDVRDLLAPHAPLRQDLAVMMDELAEAARSISALADFLNRNPNALISGRKRP